MKLLWISILLLGVLVIIRPREGYYSDTNITSAISSLKTITPILSGLQNTLQGLEATNLDASETIRNVNAVLGSSDGALDTNGVINHVRKQKNDLNVFQDNLIATTTSLKQLKQVKVSLRIGEESRTVTLAEAIPLLQTQIDELSDKLRKIPER
jgi:hypothetical protein